MLRELRNLLSFLTVLPFRMDEHILSDSARFMFFFPLVGALLGFLVGLFVWIVSWILPSLVVGGLAIGALLLLTGLHHADGLLDFADGVMAHGSPEHKIEVMHDKMTGTAGLILGVFTLLVSAFCVSSFIFSSGFWGIPVIFSGLVVAEVSAKLSMVVVAWAGRAVHEGMNSSFLVAMHGGKGNARLIAALALSLAIAVPLLWLTGAIVILVAVITGLVMVAIAHRNFNGVTGDVMGATNELSRMVVLITLLAVVQWV
jgi:adenosylcobinamide-GDP ribazoletransferase